MLPACHWSGGVCNASPFFSPSGVTLVGWVGHAHISGSVTSSLVPHIPMLVTSFGQEGLKVWLCAPLPFRRQDEMSGLRGAGLVKLRHTEGVHISHPVPRGLRVLRSEDGLGLVNGQRALLHQPT